MEPLVSIVIPIYNVEKYIEKCVNELLNQSYKNTEIVLVNDGSTDNSGIICDVLSGQFNNVKCIHQRNEGVSSARNTGTAIANGDYIMYMDADDYLINDAIDEGIKYINMYHVDMVIAREVMVQPNQLLDIKTSAESKYLILKSDEFDDLRKVYLGAKSQRLENIGNIGMISGRPCERIVRAEIAKQTLFPVGVILGEDKLWNLRLLKNCESVCVLGDCWYQYVIYGDSAVRKYHGNRKENAEIFLKTLYDENKEFCDSNSQIYLENIAIMLYCIAFYDLASKECQLSSKEKKEYMKALITRIPWRVLWSKSNSRQLSMRHRIMLRLYKMEHWILPLSIYKKIKSTI